MKVGIIKEGKTPPDHRTPLTPSDAAHLMNTYPNLQIVAQSSNLRCFTDAEYTANGVEVVTLLDDCDVILGVKEVPISALIPNKTFYFFSHTLKAQDYNRNLMLAILKNKIELIDHETIVDSTGRRLVGFGRYAGIVGAYNALLAYGIRTGKYQLKHAHNTSGIAEMNLELKKCILNNSKILITGGGKVAFGAVEILEAAGVREVSVNDYLHDSFNEPVFTRADMQDYYEFEGHNVFDRQHFRAHSAAYKSTFKPFYKCTDILISSHYWDNVSEVFFTLDDIKSKEFRISTIADITCDINGSIPTTIRPSTVADPIYNVSKNSGKETGSFSEDSITVMAVDNLPCEIPLDASTGFSEMLCTKVIPQYFNGDHEKILARGAMTTKKGQLTARFGYLQDYVNGK